MSIRIPANTAASFTDLSFFTSQGKPITLLMFSKVSAWRATAGSDYFQAFRVGDSTDNFFLGFLTGDAVSDLTHVRGGTGTTAVNDSISVGPTTAWAADEWRGTALVTESGSRTIYISDPAGIVSATETSSLSVTTNELTLFPSVYAHGDLYANHIAVYDSALTQVQVEEFFDTGEIVGVTPYVKLDATSDWGVGDIPDTSGNARNITPPAAWEFVADEPIAAAPSNTTINVDIPSDIDLEWGTTHELAVTHDGGTTTLSGVTLSAPTGWETVSFSTIPDTGTTESFYEYSQSDVTVGNFTAQVGDTLAFTSSTGLTIDGSSIPVVSPAATVTGSYKWWDASLSTWTPVSSYTITNLGVFGGSDTTVMIQEMISDMISEMVN